MRKPKQNIIKSIKDKDGKLITSEEEILDRWREYFQEMLEQEEKVEMETERRMTTEKG